jgi:LAO/AO transport system kinase
MRALSRLDPEDLSRRIAEGDRLALARGISLVEDRTRAGRVLLDLLFPRTGSAVRLGITGPPGSGKSTLTTQIVQRLRKEGQRVAILAVDPTSPFTGGAILGDRIRMGELMGDGGVFIRSMASRGHQGGLSATTYEASEVMEAAGYERIVIETVGVGQAELEVASAADTTVVVQVPESGDAVQVMKAGVMEIGDVFVVNKYDRQGGDHLLREINAILELAPKTPEAGDGGWRPPVLATVATKGEGLEELMSAFRAHQEHRSRDPEMLAKTRRRKMKERVRLMLSDHLLERIWRDGLDEELERGLDDMEERRASPYAWIDETLEEMSRAGWSRGGRKRDELPASGGREEGRGHA